MMIATAAVLPVSVAQAGWRDRYVQEDSWYDLPYAPSYSRPRTVYIYPESRGWREDVIARRRGREIYVAPEDDGWGDDERYLAPEEYGSNDERYFAPDSAARPRRKLRAQPRTGSAAAGPLVVPGLAPSLPPRRPKVASAAPIDDAPVAAISAPAAPLAPTTPDDAMPAAAVSRGVMGPSEAMPAAPHALLPPLNAAAPAPPPEPALSQAVLLPVPRPNLEGMDFAPVKPPEAATADADRR